jgi:hypothetical protein
VNDELTSAPTSTRGRSSLNSITFRPVVRFETRTNFTVVSAALNAAIEDRTRKRLQASDEEIMHSATFVMERIAATGQFPRVMAFVADAEHLDETRQMWSAVELVLDGIGTRLP